MLKFKSQLFAEETPPEGANPQGAQNTEGKTFTQDYVLALRGENAGYRTKAKSYETALKTVLGVKESDELGSIDERIAAFNRAQTSQLGAINQKVINAELRSLEGYNTKLLAKVIDLSGVKVGEDMTVTGLEDAALAAAKEFPEVQKKAPAFAGSTKGAEPGANTAKEKANAAFRAVIGKD